MDANTLHQYGRLLKSHALELVQKADARHKDDREEASRLRAIAAAIEWAVESALPRHVVLEFAVVYQAAQNDMALYQALSVAFGTQENVEIAARMRRLVRDEEE